MRYITIALYILTSSIFARSQTLSQSQQSPSKVSTITLILPSLGTAEISFPTPWKESSTSRTSVYSIKLSNDSSNTTVEIEFGENNKNLSFEELEYMVQILAMAAGHDPKSLSQIKIDGSQLKGWCNSFPIKPTSASPFTRETVGMAVLGKILVNFDIKQCGTDKAINTESL